MVSRDVDLIIRARDQARNTLNGITQALERFTGSQEGVQKQAGRDRLGDRPPRFLASTAQDPARR